MSNLLFKSENNLWFLNSFNVKVYPCAYRGTYTRENKAYLFDPEARLNTEHNLTLSTAFGRDTFIKNWSKELEVDPINPELNLTIKGYSFTISGINCHNFDDFRTEDGSIKKPLFANILLKEKILQQAPESGEDFTKSTTTVLGPLHSTGTEILDFENNGQYYFGGLAFSTSELNAFSLDDGIDGQVYSLKIYEGVPEDSEELYKHPIEAFWMIDASNVGVEGGSSGVGAHEVYIGPKDEEGSPSFRRLQSDDLPNVTADYLSNKTVESRPENSYELHKMENDELKWVPAATSAEDGMLYIKGQGPEAEEIKLFSANESQNQYLNFVAKIGDNDPEEAAAVRIQIEDNSETTPKATFIFDNIKGKQGTGLNIKANREDCKQIGDGYIDADGNLWILTGSDPEEIDSWKNAGQIKGPKGDQGEQGIQGDQGPKGPQGPKGDDGADAVINGANATITNTWGEPSATVTWNRNTKYFSFNFKNLKGDPGEAATYTSGTNITIGTNNTISLNDSIILSGTVTATSFSATSDIRKKENIQDYTSEKSILDLPVKKFDFIDGKKNNIGCIAQDLQEICPEIVHADEDGYLSIEENKLVYLLLAEVKKLKSELDKLKK